MRDIFKTLAEELGQVVLAEDVEWAGFFPFALVELVDSEFDFDGGFALGVEVAGGKATLSVGPLRRTNDIFGGVFEMKVVPYFFKSEKGTLAIEITSESFAKASKGMTVDIAGTATSTGKNRLVRKINVVATSAGDDRGALKIWFMVDDRKMVFDTMYQFVEP